MQVLCRLVIAGQVTARCATTPDLGRGAGPDLDQVLQSPLRQPIEQVKCSAANHSAGLPLDSSRPAAGFWSIQISAVQRWHTPRGIALPS